MILIKRINYDNLIRPGVKSFFIMLLVCQLLLVDSGKDSFISLTRWYGAGNPKNNTTYLELSPRSKFYSMKQFQTRYVIVSMDQHLEFFDVVAKTKIG